MPWRLRLAARFTLVVVLPTPPFWLATVTTRGWSGRGSFSLDDDTRAARLASSIKGVSSKFSTYSPFFLRRMRMSVVG